MKCVEITPGTPEEGDTFTAARSNHVGGVNVIFADGSAKFYTDRVDRKGWTALAATRAGGDASSTSDIDGMSGIPMVAEHPWFARTASSSRWVYELPAFDCPVGATHST
jgi:prepilin-type processing-associated H-X9-DG protein